MAIINVEHLVKDYGFNRGNFDVNFVVNKGEVFGFLGPNGAGKTTTIRHILGFSKPDSGNIKINDLDSWNNRDEILKTLGYLPGEVALPEFLTGLEFIKYMADLRGLTNLDKAHELIKQFSLDANCKIKKLSLGEKRKLAIVCAFMHDPSVLILDEPTSGLDHMMQAVFIEFIKNEKAKGKTILLSSHIFNEVEATCDRVAIIKEGKVVSNIDMKKIKIQTVKTFKLEFLSVDELKDFLTLGYNVTSVDLAKSQVKVNLNDDKINDLVKSLLKYKLKYLSQQPYTLEDYFMHYYTKEEQ